MTKRKSKLLILSCLLATICVAQQELNYDAYIGHVRANHPMSTRASNLTQKGELNYRSAQGGFDPALLADFESKNFNAKNYYTTVETKIKQPLYTSQYITAGYEYAQGYYLNPDLRTPRDGLPFIGIEASVLQGLVIDKRRAEVLKSKGYKNYYEAEKNTQINDLLFTASLTYFDWVFSCRELSLYSYFLSLAERRYQGIKSLATIGERAPVDTIEALMLLRGRSLDMQSATIEYQKRKASVLSFNWLAPDQPSQIAADARLLDSLEPCYERARLAYLHALNGGDHLNPTLVKYQATREILKVDKKYKAELIKPKLDLKYNFLFNTFNPDGPTMAASNYRVGAYMSFPLLFRSAINDYKMSKLELANNELELNNKSNELNYKINLTKQSIATLTDQISLAQSNVDYSRQLVSAEVLKFDHGESSLFLVNSREVKLLESELKLAEYKLKFIRYYLEYVYLRGDLAYSL